MNALLVLSAIIGSLASPMASILPQQKAVKCSAAEWIWDTLVQDIGCTVSNPS